LNRLEQVNEENQKIAFDIIQLAQTEDSKIVVDAAIYIRLNKYFFKKE
jgi:nucleoside-triphosphatase THEP1